MRITGRRSLPPPMPKHWSDRDGESSVKAMTAIEVVNSTEDRVHSAEEETLTPSPSPDSRRGEPLGSTYPLPGLGEGGAIAPGEGFSPGEGHSHLQKRPDVGEISGDACRRGGFERPGLVRAVDPDGGDADGLGAGDVVLGGVADEDRFGGRNRRCR